MRHGSRWAEKAAVKGKANKIDLTHLDYEEAVKRAWEAEPPPRSGKLDLSHLTPEEIAKQVLETPPERQSKKGSPKTKRAGPPIE